MVTVLPMQMDTVPPLTMLPIPVVTALQGQKFTALPTPMVTVLQGSESHGKWEMERWVTASVYAVCDSCCHLLRVGCTDPCSFSQENVTLSLLRNLFLLRLCSPVSPAFPVFPVPPVPCWLPVTPVPPWIPELPAPPWHPELPVPPWHFELPAPPLLPEPVPFLGIGELGGRLGRHQPKGCQWAHVLPLHFNRVVIKSGTVTLKYDCRPHWIPNIIGLEYCQSDDACMPLDQSAVNCCLIVACLHLERSSTPLDQWALSVLWQCNAFYLFIFLPCNKAKFKGQFKILVQ